MSYIEIFNENEYEIRYYLPISSCPQNYAVGGLSGDIGEECAHCPYINKDVELYNQAVVVTCVYKPCIKLDRHHR